MALLAKCDPASAGAWRGRRLTWRGPSQTSGLRWSRSRFSTPYEAARPGCCCRRCSRRSGDRSGPELKHTRRVRRWRCLACAGRGRRLHMSSAQGKSTFCAWWRAGAAPRGARDRHRALRRRARGDAARTALARDPRRARALRCAGARPGLGRRGALDRRRRDRGRRPHRMDEHGPGGRARSPARPADLEGRLPAGVAARRQGRSGRRSPPDSPRAAPPYRCSSSTARPTRSCP